MKHLRRFLLASLLPLTLAASAEAQLTPSPTAALTNLTPQKTPDRLGSVVLSEQQASELAELPRISERQRLPEEIKQRLRRFELARVRYVNEQQALLKQYRGAATEEERQRIRALYEKQRSDLLERAKTLREEVGKRLEVIRERMPSMNEVLDDARKNARDTAAQGRKRRGQD
jgi:hypothetical protein